VDAAYYKNELNIDDSDILIINDTISGGQSVKRACQIMLESYAPKSITVLALLPK
jgi:hypoxanthine-guanine phosphoribosyltransferase